MIETELISCLLNDVQLLPPNDVNKQATVTTKRAEKNNTTKNIETAPPPLLAIYRNTAHPTPRRLQRPLFDEHPPRCRFVSSRVYMTAA